MTRLFRFRGRSWGRGSWRRLFRQRLGLQTRFTLVAAGAVAATALAITAVAFLAIRTDLENQIQQQLTARAASVEHAADRVAFGRPQVKKAFIVLARNRALGLAQIEGHGAILEYDGTRGLAEEVPHDVCEGVGGHEGNCPHWADPCL